MKLILATIILAMLSGTAIAQETQPGDPCTAGEIHRVKQVGGPENPGTGYLLVCNGSAWKTVTEWSTTTGSSLSQVANDSGPCTASKDGRIRYVSSGNPPWEYCDGSVWSPFRQPRCQNDGTGECFLDATRSNDDPQFSSPNIASGVNILGVTGTLDGAEPDCTNDSSITCTLDATRSNSDADFIASNILCGKNVLGVIGTGGTVSPPNAFSFTDQTDVAPSSFIYSNITQITGLSCPVTVSISGAGSPQYRICNDPSCSSIDHNFTGANGTIDNNQYLQLVLTSNAAASTMNSATVTVYATSDQWDVTTMAPFSGKRVFVTSTQYTTSIGGVSGADSICATRASAAGLSGTFKAWIADGNNSSAPATRFTHAAVAYGLPGTFGPKIADNWTDLTDGTLDNAISKDEFGNSPFSGDVLTNVQSNGTRKGADHCVGWTSTNFSNNAHHGSSSNTDSSWTDFPFTTTCSILSNKRLFCFEQ